MEKQTSRLEQLTANPIYQALFVVGLIIIFSLVDMFLPHSDEVLESKSGTWIVATAMILFFVILNAIVALRIEPIMPYWGTSLITYVALLAFGYGWCFVLTGKHIDEVGNFRWLWLVLTLVYLVFFIIARTMKRIVDVALRQDEKIREEE